MEQLSIEHALKGDYDELYVNYGDHDEFEKYGGTLEYDNRYVLVRRF